MSRCFPYPPPGYVRGETSLAESIKLQKLKEQEKERKKDKKREHKEKKDKKRSREIISQPLDETQFQKKRRIDREAKADEKVQFQQEFLPDQKLQFLPDRKVLQPEDQLEKSGLTEELGQPHQPYQCGSPESSASEDSSKRRRIHDNKKTQTTQPTGLRIRFALSKPKTTEVASIAPLRPKTTEVVASIAPLKPKTTEVATVAPSNILRLPVPASTSSRLVVPPAAAASLVTPIPASVSCVAKEKEVAPESSHRTLFSERAEASTSGTTSDGSALLDGGYRGSKKSRKREAKFNDLFLSWAPLPFEPLVLEVEDEDAWLFNTSRQPRQARLDAGTCLDLNDQQPIADSLCSWPPRARHLKDADVYALPYVVPF